VTTARRPIRLHGDVRLSCGYLPRLLIVVAACDFAGLHRLTGGESHGCAGASPRATQSPTQPGMALNANDLARGVDQQFTKLGLTDLFCNRGKTGQAVIEVGATMHVRGEHLVAILTQ
jgi:hypothetical protein